MRTRATASMSTRATFKDIREKKLNHAKNVSKNLIDESELTDMITEELDDGDYGRGKDSRMGEDVERPMRITLQGSDRICVRRPMRITLQGSDHMRVRGDGSHASPRHRERP